MSSTLAKELKPVVPIYEDGAISLRKLSVFMGTTQQSIACIIQRDVRTVQRDKASKAIAKHIQPLVYALQMLFELTNYNTDEVKRWLAEPKTQWRGLSPLDCLEQGNVDAVVNLVSRIYYGDSAGY